MQSNAIGRMVWSGAVAAAAFLMAPKAHAASWCPTSTTNIIACSNCSRELTCDLNGFGIKIVGNGVVLDGQNHYINYAPGRGIEVQGTGNIIKNIFIESPAHTGISFIASASDGSTPNIIDHVKIYSAYSSGVINASNNSGVISYSDIYYSGGGGVNTTSPRYMDVTNSSVGLSLIGNGYFAQMAANNSLLLNSTFSYNSSMGVNLLNVTGITIQGNTFTFNDNSGLGLWYISGTLKNNAGWLNDTWDCDEYHTGTLNLNRSGNDWGLYTGSGCVP